MGLLEHELAGAAHQQVVVTLLQTAASFDAVDGNPTEQRPGQITVRGVPLELVKGRYARQVQLRDRIRERIGHRVRQYREPSLRPELPNDDGLLEVEQGCKPACLASRVSDERRVGEDRSLRDRERQRPAVAIEQRPPGGRQLDGAEALAVAVRDIAAGVQDLNVREPDDDEPEPDGQEDEEHEEPVPGATTKQVVVEDPRLRQAGPASRTRDPTRCTTRCRAGAGHPRDVDPASPRDRKTDRGDWRPSWPACPSRYLPCACFPCAPERRSPRSLRPTGLRRR